MSRETDRVVYVRMPLTEYRRLERLIAAERKKRLNDYVSKAHVTLKALAAGLDALL
jgi:hypothetical protein